MMSYKIFLTKSEEDSVRIAESYDKEYRTEDIHSVNHGKADSQDCIPPIYYGKGYFCCVIVLKEWGTEPSTYELTIY